MRIEKIFSKIPGFENITLDIVLFESRYPVMFTCKNEHDVYLFICCLAGVSKTIWIGTKTDYNTLIGLLENKITIQNAFLAVTEEKIIIEYDGQNIIHITIDKEKIDINLLPTAGEYMDAEDDEFLEEIAVFTRRNAYMEYMIKPQAKKLLMLNNGNCIMLTDDYFNLCFDTADVTEYSIGKIQAFA